MAKVLKFGLMLDDCNVRSLEGLQEHFVIEDVLKYFEDGTLSRWLKVWGYKEQLAAVEAIEKTLDKRDIVLQLANIFGIEDVDAADIEKALSVFIAEAAYEYLAGYEALIVNMKKRINLYLKENKDGKLEDVFYNAIPYNEFQKMGKEYWKLILSPFWLASGVHIFLTCISKLTEYTDVEVIKQFLSFSYMAVLDSNEHYVLGDFDIDKILKRHYLPSFSKEFIFKKNIEFATSVSQKLAIKEYTTFKKKAVYEYLVDFEALILEKEFRNILKRNAQNIPQIILQITPQKYHKLFDIDLSKIFITLAVLYRSNYKEVVNFLDSLGRGANKNNER